MYIYIQYIYIYIYIIYIYIYICDVSRENQTTIMALTFEEHRNLKETQLCFGLESDSGIVKTDQGEKKQLNLENKKSTTICSIIFWRTLSCLSSKALSI